MRTLHRTAEPTAGPEVVAGAGHPVLRRLVGMAGLGYVLGAAIENMAILDAPLMGSPIADIRSAYADHALLIVTSLAGVLALVFYSVFCAGLVRLLRDAEQRPEAWPLVALVGGVGGPVIAATGLAANAILVAGHGSGLSADVTRALFELYLIARMLAGPFMSLLLLGTGIAALRSRALPARLGALACAAAVPLALTPLAAFTGERLLQIAAAVAFGSNSLWILLASLWLTLGGEVPVVTLVRRGAFLMLVLAAGLVGVALIAVPAATGAFFSWGLAPEPLAAFAGGVYVASALVYAAGIAAPWRQARGLVVGAAVLSVSVFTITLAHLEVFDFHRLQAWAWLVLFAGFAVVMSTLLVLGREDHGHANAGARLALWARAMMAAVAALLAALAVALWIDPVGIGGPFALPPLGGRFAGAWIATLAALAGWAGLRNRRDEARLPALALIALPLGALAAALRTITELEAGTATTGYLVALALLATLGAAVTRHVQSRARAGDERLLELTSDRTRSRRASRAA
jgi:hypothetical protein